MKKLLLILCAFLKIGVGSPFDINTDPANNVNEICNPLLNIPISSLASTSTTNEAKALGRIA
jgi:hypothetical protein